MNTTEKETDLAIALDTLKRVAHWADKGGLLIVTIMHTSKSNLSFKLDARMYYHSEGETVSMYLNWAYAHLMNARQDESGLVKWNGLGIERAFEVANNLERLISKHLDQSVEISYQGIY